MSGVIELLWISECTKYEYHPVDRSHWIMTAEINLTVLSWNPTLEFSTAEPHGCEFLISACEQQQIAELHWAGSVGLSSLQNLVEVGRRHFCFSLSLYKD